MKSVGKSEDAQSVFLDIEHFLADLNFDSLNSETADLKPELLERRQFSLDEE